MRLSLSRSLIKACYSRISSFVAEEMPPILEFGLRVDYNATYCFATGVTLAVAFCAVVSVMGATAVLVVFLVGAMT